jgi:serine/threonine protein phosphatase 1
MDRLLELEQRCQLIPLLGNHELMMLQSFEDPAQAHFWLQCGGQATLDSYGGSPECVPDDHLNFLRRCVPYYETDHHFFIHANYDSTLPLGEQPPDLMYCVHLHECCPLPHLSVKTAVVGHTPQRDGQVLRLDGVICLDTFCVGDGWLTALDVNGGELWQFNRLGQGRAEGPKNINEVPLH